MKKIVLAVLAMAAFCSIYAQDIESLWQNPTNDYRVKAWWFFGYENTSDEGITADVASFCDAGLGGVVYYDQNHRNKDNVVGLGTPDEGFSPQWWHHLRFAAKEAKRAGLSFELNISNGYVAGGKWIDPDHAMQRVSSASVDVEGGRHINISLPEITGPENYVKDIAVLAFPRMADDSIRHFTALYTAGGKGRNGRMQKPDPKGKFSGYGWKELPSLGTLQVSDDSIFWRDVITIEPMYSSQGGYYWRTNAFPAVKGRFWRVNNTQTGDSLKLRKWFVGSEPKFDRWEERAALQSDFAEDSRTPSYSRVISPGQIIDLTDMVSGGELHWDAPKGEWTVLRLAAVLTGAKSKHGRENLIGYECDKLSKEAAELQWNSYVQVILDSLGKDAGVSGIAMDSHEGGSQNWTPLMLREFSSRRGYDFRPYLPVLAGYVVGSKEKTEDVLRDYRQTIADCITDNYYGTFQRLASGEGLHFTAQAIGNALCIDGDAIAVKKAVEKPQGEFWAYQKEGAYDIKDCSSAAHLYGKPIASAEALTDAGYVCTAYDLDQVSNIAFSFGAQEFVICAIPHIPYADGKASYFAGRDYGINRTNPRWDSFKPVWEQAARSAVLLRQGVAASDVLVYLGDDIPVKILTGRLPEGLDGLDWDACTGDALRLMKGVDGLCWNPLLPEPIKYRAVAIADCSYISPESRAKLEELDRAGVPIISDASTLIRPMEVVEGDPKSIVHTRRLVSMGGKGQSLYYIASVSPEVTKVKIRFNDDPDGIQILWNNRTGEKAESKSNSDGTLTLTLQPGESVFITR